MVTQQNYNGSTRLKYILLSKLPIILSSDSFYYSQNYSQFKVFYYTIYYIYKVEKPSVYLSVGTFFVMHITQLFPHRSTSCKFAQNETPVLREHKVFFYPVVCAVYGALNARV